jgi:hypothetical protein
MYTVLAAAWSSGIVSACRAMGREIEYRQGILLLCTYHVGMIAVPVCTYIHTYL